MIPQPATSPPLGDLSTRQLVAAMMIAWRTGRPSLRCRIRGITLDHLRSEIIRREMAV
jgi:hypothetical protein